MDIDRNGQIVETLTLFVNKEGKSIPEIIGISVERGEKLSDEMSYVLNIMNQKSLVFGIAINTQEIISEITGLAKNDSEFLYLLYQAGAINGITQISGGILPIIGK